MSSDASLNKTEDTIIWQLNKIINNFGKNSINVLQRIGLNCKWTGGFCTKTTYFTRIRYQPNNLKILQLLNILLIVQFLPIFRNHVGDQSNPFFKVGSSTNRNAGLSAVSSGKRYAEMLSAVDWTYKECVDSRGRALVILHIRWIYKFGFGYIFNKWFIVIKLLTIGNFYCSKRRLCNLCLVINGLLQRF